MPRYKRLAWGRKEKEEKIVMHIIFDEIKRGREVSGGRQRKGDSITSVKRGRRW